MRSGEIIPAFFALFCLFNLTGCSQCTSPLRTDLLAPPPPAPSQSATAPATDHGLVEPEMGDGMAMDADGADPAADQTTEPPNTRPSHKHHHPETITPQATEE